MNLLRSSIQEHKVAPKRFKCSNYGECGSVIEQGRVYIKTNSGRYCGACADRIEYTLVLQQALP